MKREEKAQEEAEKAKQGEVERRKVGQDMARLKQWKEERERKEFENSYKKQKEEDRLAREKVRADLERDRSVTMWNSYVNISNEASKMFMSLLNFSSHLFLLCFYYSAPSRGAKYCDDHVCLCVCLSFCPQSNLWNYTFDLCKLFVRLTCGCGLGPPLMA